MNALSSDDEEDQGVSDDRFVNMGTIQDEVERKIYNDDGFDWGLNDDELEVPNIELGGTSVSNENEAHMGSRRKMSVVRGGRGKRHITNGVPTPSATTLSATWEETASQPASITHPPTPSVPESSATQPIARSTNWC
ncbi:uncharacterized protein A4U43_C10F11300 [Asparagus officinalis]|uniref:Uncharacterized protein n=1 Tax=Asparagus officinalis TaxID=4686 RepID=A0A5P1E5A3_ASPOF|nr:uncharacterized protein A4U43_C10F11300 [Asparagus officinalis]